MKNKLISLICLLATSGVAQITTVSSTTQTFTESRPGDLSVLTSVLPPTYLPSDPTNSMRSITHADVIYIPEGFGGATKYRYWLLATPFPKAALENPCIYASHDGYTWATPAVNPIHTLAQAQSIGYEWQADTDLVYASNGQLQAYWMGFTSSAAPSNTLLRSVSTDGVSWSAAYKSFDNNAGASSDDRPMVSPSLVVETNGNLTMFYTRALNTYANDEKLAWRESTDNGETWGSETLINYSTNRAGWPNPWNFNVTLVNGWYYGIVKNGNLSTDFEQTFGYSSNKTDWYFDATPAFYQTGLTNLDSGAGGGTYRTALIAKRAMPPIWDCFVSGAPSKQMTGASFPGTANNDQPWLIYRVEDVTFPMRSFRMKERTMIYPALSAMNAATATTWSSANRALGNRFQLTEPTRIRYINFELGVSSGNIEVGICFVDPSDANGLQSWVVATSGAIASPGTGARKVDLGFQTLGPGHYILYFWADNTTITTFHTDSSTAASLAGTELGVYVDGNTAVNGFVLGPTETWQENTDRALTGFSITDY